MRFIRKSLKTFLICSLIVISGGRSTNTRVEYNNEEDQDQDTDENDSNLYFNGGEEAVGDKLVIAENDLPKNGELFEGDMVMDNELRRAVLGEESKKAAVLTSETARRKHWPGGVIPYVIDKSLIKLIRDKIPIARRIFEHFTCIKWVPLQPGEPRPDDYVKIANGDGCSSSVGRIGGVQTIHLGFHCKRLGTVMHEMMHVLGIIHEQSRPDRDEYLKINFKNIKKGTLANFQKYSFDQADTLKTPYNYFSVMHYSNHAFSKNDGLTLISKYDAHLRFGQRKMISHLDVVEINRLYPCHKDVSKMDHCMDMECERKPRCCLFRDKTPAIILDEKKRKDVQRNEMNHRLEDLLFNYLRDDDDGYNDGLDDYDDRYGSE